MSFDLPALGFLALPMFWLIARWPALTSVRLLRVALTSCVVLALAGPRCERFTPGATLVVLVDRSASMPGAIESEAEEWITRAERARGADDRLIVVEFAAEARIVHDSLRSQSFRGFPSLRTRHDSRLDRALQLALGMLTPEAQARFVIFSDGRVDETATRAEALAASARRIPLDVRWIERAASDDVSVRDLELPLEVERDAQFSFAAWVHCESQRTLTWVLRRGQQERSRATREFARGWNRIDLRDRLSAPGIHRYEFQIEGAQDARPENDRSEAALEVIGPRGLLLLNRTGELGELGTALQGGDLDLTVGSPSQIDLSPAALRQYRAILIDDLPADAFGRDIENLANFVQHDGGGLLLGGGQSSFGLGGYHLSALDPLLPVSMELVPERKEFGLALICLLDNSGSMSVPATDGQTKLQLAGAGAAAALRLLGKHDAGGAITVDTEATTVFELGAMNEREAELDRFATLKQGGGGINVRTALAAAEAWTKKLVGYRRHIVLFADASDAEEQNGAHEWISKAHEDGITLSVIALGNSNDDDSQFLQECARRGGGGCYFTERAEDLPQLFARDTLVASMQAFVHEPTAVAARGELLQLGALELDAFPTVPGYNRTILRPQAILGAETIEAEPAPILAWTWSELGRVAAFTASLSGPEAGELTAWPAYRELFRLLASWLAGSLEAHPYAAVTTYRGPHVTVALEGEDGTPALDLRNTAVIFRDERGLSVHAAFEVQGKSRWRAQLELPAPGLWLGVVRCGAQSAIQLPPIVYSTASELAPPIDADAGRLHLFSLAALSECAIDPFPERSFLGSSRERSSRSIANWFLWIAFACFLLEIARRRLGPQRSSARLQAQKPSRSWRTWLRSQPTDPRTDRATPRAGSSEPAPEPEPAMPRSALDSALKQARQRAHQRLDRSS